VLLVLCHVTRIERERSYNREAAQRQRARLVTALPTLKKEKPRRGDTRKGERGQGKERKARKNTNPERARREGEGRAEQGGGERSA